MTTENEEWERANIAFGVVPDIDGLTVRLGVYNAETKKFRFQFTLTEESARALAQKLTKAAWEVQDASRR